MARRFSVLAIAVSTAVAASAGAAFADEALENALKARKGQFQLLAFNVGVLGGMARGNAEYDAAQAQVAAENIQAIAALNQAAFWPEGSDSMSIDGTRAMPVIWDNFDDFASKWQAVAAAAEGLPAAVGAGVAGIGPALGPIGGTCKDCHDTYRAPRN
ncbi:c-type cytochrome [Tropicimonas sp. S265A]|uniref:c-type cytochrome n=1 Tax=Tropicimonas sp. S265A TaxID=3415134 RepID=UPI003C798BF8